jgi:hypothetical protein
MKVQWQVIRASPGSDPILNLVMRNPFAAIERGDGAPDAGHLPFIEFEIFADGLGSEKGATATRTLGQSLQPFLHVRIDAHRKGCRLHEGPL